MKQALLYSKYPRKSEFLLDYNPSLQAKLIKTNVSLCEIALNDGIPSLGLLSSTYGEELSVEWLKIQFGSLNDYAEQGVGLKPEQLNELSELFLAEYYYMNAAEICLFIARLKLGKYGQFYGAIGPMKIMSSAMEYSKERRLSIEQFERDNDRKKRENKCSTVVDTGASMIKGLDAFRELQTHAQTEYSAFREIYPKIPHESQGNMWWEAWKGNPDALSIIYPNIETSLAQRHVTNYLYMIQNK